MKKMTGAEIFANDPFWSNYGKTPDYAERITIIHSLIPIDTTSLLDVGCGKGDVINALLKNNPTLRIMGVDPFIEAIQYLNVPGVQATLPNIPFPDKHFDLVICLQVLEHLGDQDFLPSVLEIQRLSKKYVIIGVPYKENPQTLQVLCSNCGRKSHAYGHLRSFKESALANLLPDFTMERSILCGVLQRRNSIVGILFQHHIANLYSSPSDFVCPHCFSNAPAASDRSKVVCWIAPRFNQILTKLSPVMPYWIIALYKRKDNNTAL